MARTTYRNAKKERFTPVSNSLLWDNEASLQAKGLLSIFLSNSDDWEINMKNIIKRSRNGRDAQYKVVNELIELGYFARVQVLDPVTRKFEEMIYIFSDVKQEVADELENLKQHVAANNKTLVIEYKTKKEKKTKGTPKEPFPENQDAEKKPFPGSQDTENKDTKNQEINNTNSNNTNFNNTNKNLNLNPNEVNIYDLLWNTEIPERLKIRIRVLLENHSIYLSEEQILEIENAYFYQKQKGYIIPRCAAEDIKGLNDFEFTGTIEKMLKTVKNIENIKGLIKSWVLTAYDYKCQRLHVSDYSGYQINKNVPFYNWLES